jgi:hypothetical protein
MKTGPSEAEALYTYQHSPRQAPQTVIIPAAGLAIGQRQSALPLLLQKLFEQVGMMTAPAGRCRPSPVATSRTESAISFLFMAPPIRWRVIAPASN